MQIQDRVEIRDLYGKVEVTGYIELSKPAKLLNKANNGKYYLDWVEPRLISLEVGTRVHYKRSQTQTGLFHTITYTNDQGSFEKVVKTNKVKYGSTKRHKLKQRKLLQ